MKICIIEIGRFNQEPYRLEAATTFIAGERWLRVQGFRPGSDHNKELWEREEFGFWEYARFYNDREKLEVIA